MSAGLILPPALAAFAVTAAAEPVAITVLRRGRILDMPNSRSSHLAPVPRGGGIAVAFGVFAGLGVASGVTRVPSAGLLIAGTGFGLLGLADDLRSLPVFVRLGVQAVAAALTLPWLLRGTTGMMAWKILFAIGVLLWLVAFVNAFNFMDGINGISVGQAVVAGAFWCAVGLLKDTPALAVGGLIIAAAALGFAPYNFPIARVFLGDAGSYFFGACLAVLAVVGLRASLAPEAVMGPLVIYLADTAATILRRSQRGECWHAAHRDHAYQRLARQGLSHLTVAALAAVAMLLTSLLGLVSLAAPPLMRALADVMIGGVVFTYLASPTLFARRSPGPAAA